MTEDEIAQDEYDFILGGILKRALENKSDFTIAGRIESLNNIRLKRIGYRVEVIEREYKFKDDEVVTRIEWGTKKKSKPKRNKK